MKLRDYQEAAVAAVMKEWASGVRSTLVTLPTGMGKTIAFAEITRRMLAKGRVMILAHREELIKQAVEKVGRLTGVDVQMEMAEFEATPLFGKEPPVVVSTVQTQVRGRMQKFDPNDFAAVIIDEAHHAIADSYRECLGWYLQNPALKVCGVTATPDRADEIALGNVFESVAYEYSTADAIRDGWLVPIRQEFVKCESLDFSRVTASSSGDLNQAELAEVMEEERNLHGIAAPTLSIVGARRTIVFCASVKQSERLAEIFGRSGVKADWVCGQTPKDERRRKLDAFASGETQILCNVGILTEGYDCDKVEVCVMARPTKSRALYAQMVGRATRPAAEIAGKLGNAANRCELIAQSSKPSCLIVDFVGNSGRHKLMTTLDILGGKDLDEEVVKEAKELLETAEKDLSALDALEEARDRIAARRELEKRRRAYVQATARFVRVSVDPFNRYDLPPVEAHAADAGKSLSEGQKRMLRDRLKVEPDELGYARSKQLLDESFKRYAAGLASLPQARFLRLKGVPVAMDKAEASRTIGRLIGR